MIRLNYLLFLFVLLISPISKAQEKICEGEDCAVGIQQGEIAQFTGQLITTSLAVKLGQKAEYCDRYLELEIGKLKSIHKLELDYEKAVQTLKIESWNKQEKLLLQKLEEKYKEKWYRHPAIVATVSVVLTVALIYGSSKLLQVL